MCGRYALYSDIEQLRGYFPIDQVACEFEPNYNMAPTQEVPAIVKQYGRNILFYNFLWVAGLSVYPGIQGV